MARTVEKWVAGIYDGRLYVAKGHFKETKRQLRREGGSHADEVDLALGFGHMYSRDTDLLHDTQEEALDALYSRELKKIRVLRGDVEKIQDHLNMIDDFGA
jgi:hypothetical protein